jgi:MFS family permease
LELREARVEEREPSAATAGGWRAWLALNASTGALLAAILLVGMGSELWSPFMPKYLDLLKASILLIALYGFARDFLEALAYYLGGTVAARFNTRRALLLCNALPLIGLVILLAWESKYAVFVALPFVGIWTSISGPAMLRVVGDSLATHRRSMAFSLQSIQKRLSNLLAQGISMLLVFHLGALVGVRTAIALSLGLVALSLLIQYRYMRTAVVDQVLVLHKPWALLRQFDPQLRRLLVSDIFARWCEGMPREFIILYCVASLVDLRGWPHDAAVAFYPVLLIVMNVTSLVLYLPIGHLASKAGAAKKPFIGLTFVFFALYPLTLVVLGPWLGVWGLILAFVVGGMREIGEPARKAMITELAPPALRTQAIGVYWAARSVGVMLAPLVGGLIWYCFDSPEAMLWCAAGLGAVGAGLFYVRFAGAAPSAGR